MTIEADGGFVWDEERLYDGIRQSNTESTKRVRVQTNLNWINKEALTKDSGLTKLSQNGMAGGANVGGGIRAFIDAHHDDGTQRLIGINSITGTPTYDAFFFDVGTRAWTAQGRAYDGAADTDFDLQMFNNKVIVLNGVDPVESITAAGTFTVVPGNMPVAKFATIHAERLIVGGMTSDPRSFQPTGIRDETDVDLSLAVNVTGPRGEVLTNLSRLGRFLIAQTRTSTHLYELGTDNPRDWDRVDVSNSIGCINHKSYVHIERGRGDNVRAYGFFWSDEGPYLITLFSRGEPTLVPLWEPIHQMVKGTDFQGLRGLRTASADKIVGAYVPQLNEVKFGVRPFDVTTANNMFIAVDLDSAIGYAGGQIPYPFWRIRNNEYINTTFPASVIGNIRVDKDTGLPSTTGKEWTFTGRGSFLYRMDTPEVYTDITNANFIPIEYRRAGYSGKEDGIQDRIKDVTKVRLRSTEVPNTEITVIIIGDGGKMSGDDQVSLDGDVTVWNESKWLGGYWEQAEFVNKKGEVHAQGRQFDLQLLDFGAIRIDWKLDGYALMGLIEDRR